jgi:hypothetical protein
VSPDGGKKEFPPSPVEEIDPHTPIRAGFQQNAPQDGDVVLQDLDQNLGSLLSLNDSPARHMHRFNSIGRRDSLRMNERPPIDFDAPRPKTKRELERERLFRMVDQEIAEDGSSGAGPTSGRSWGVVEIGSGLKTSPPAHNELAHPEAGSSLAPMLTPVEEVSSEPPSKSASPALSALSDKPASPAPQLQVQTVSPPGPSTKVLNDDSSNETSPIERTQAAPLHDAPRETESERFEAIRNYSRSVSTRRALGSRSTSRAPSRAPSRGPSRRGSMTDEPPSPPRSPRRRDTNRVSLVAGRVVQPLSFPGLMPLTSLNKDAGLKASLQNFSPFRPKDALVAGALSVPSVADRGNVSHAPSTTVPSECATPSSECAGGAGGHGIDDYVLLREAGKGAYGLVLRAKAKGANGEPVGVSRVVDSGKVDNMLTAFSRTRSL